MPNPLPTVGQIHRIHDRVVEVWQLDQSGIQGYLVDRKLARLLDDLRAIPDPYLQAATLLKRLVAMHVYEDGNKRTAWLTMRHTLEQQGLEPAGDRGVVATILKHIGSYSVEEIASWLETGAIDESRLRR